ncbi:hypothetical protein Tco_0218069 [Tanacetum coccineum]
MSTEQAFKKVCWERHEYANEWFLGGRSDLLSNITRREKYRPLIGPAAMFFIMEIEIFMNWLKAIQQEQERSKNGQHFKVDERGEHNALKDNNNIEAQSSFQGLQIDLEAVQKLMEWEDTWIFAREIAHCLSMTT